MTTKKAITGMIIAAAMLFSGSNSAQASVNAPAPNGKNSGETTVQVSVPEFIILHYYSDLTLNFAAPTQTVDEGAMEWENVAWTSGSYDGEIKLTKDAVEVNNDDKVQVNLDNLWAVRGFSSKGKAKISIENKTPNMVYGEANNQSVISMGDLMVTSTGVKSGTGIEVPLNGISKARATKGGVSMTLDFSKTTTSGMHTGGVYKITAETI